MTMRLVFLVITKHWNELNVRLYGREFNTVTVWIYKLFRIKKKGGEGPGNSNENFNLVHFQTCRSMNLWESNLWLLPSRKNETFENRTRKSVSRSWALCNVVWSGESDFGSAHLTCTISKTYSLACQIWAVFIATHLCKQLFSLMKQNRHS